MLKQLIQLTPRLGLTDLQEEVLRTYEIICQESLAIPLNCRAPEFSRINEDGTPFQFVLSLGPWRPSLQFLSETGVPGSSNADRIALTRERLFAISTVFGIEKTLLGARQILDWMAPSANHELLADHAGVYWIGVAFPPLARPQLKVYVNAKWGTEHDQWARLTEFASYFHALDHWRELQKLLNGAMHPLGLALTFSADLPLSGRIYVSAFGNPLGYYQQLSQCCASKAFLDAFQQYSEILLAEERRFPIRSAVCSLGFGLGSVPEFKFELCAHCLFTSDTDAVTKCVAWLRLRNISATAYFDMLEILSDRHLSNVNVNHHCFVGIGCKQDELHSSIYLKPSMIRN